MQAALRGGGSRLAYEWGHGDTAAGKRTTSSGPYLTVWKKGADGRWAIVRNLVF